MNPVFLHRSHLLQGEAEGINHEKDFSNDESVLLSELDRDHKQNKKDNKAVGSSTHGAREVVTTDFVKSKTARMEGTFRLRTYDFIFGLGKKGRTDNDQAEGPYEDRRSGLVSSYT